jgi:uncharacterized protein
MNLIILEHKYSVYKFKVGSVLPEWIFSSDFYSITGTPDEISVVAPQTGNTGEKILRNDAWRIIKVMGPLDFSLVGIIADLSSILRNKNISIFTVSTYDTDYILVKQNDLDTAIEALEESGHTVRVERTEAPE